MSRNPASSRASHLRRRERLATLGLGLAAAAIVLPLFRSGVLHGVELKTMDARMRLRGAIPPTSEVVVVAVDARSVDRLGQWPWPRAVLADLVRRISSAGARTIALDMVFAEPSREGPTQDEELASALREAGSVVLGFFLTGEEGEPGLALEPPPGIELAVTPRGGFSEIPAWPGIEANLALLAGAAPAAGHFGVLPDADGTVRHYSLVARHRETFYPALALRAVQAYLGAPGLSLRPDRRGLPRLLVGELELPASERGELWVNFLGPYRRTFAYHPAADVLDGRVAAEAFDDKLVFVAATETGLSDLRTTPWDNVAPGVEVHATVADNLLRRRFIRDGAPETLLGMAAILLLGPAGGAFAAFSRRPARGALLAATAVAAYAGLTQLAFVRGSRHLELVAPLGALALGYTAAAVWRNVFAEARAREIRATFSRFVSPAVVEEMLRDPDRVRLGGEKRELTVLFADLRGFTTMSERLPPEQVGTLLNEFMTPMTQVLLDRGGTLDKYMGDAIMGFFGAPLAQPDHARRGCETALAMREALRRLNHGWAQRDLPRLALGIGLNSGPMAVGNMGSAMIFDYTVIGDEVNLGSRLEGLTRLYGVEAVASEATVAAAGPGFAFRELDRVRVKGRREPVRVFELAAPEDAAASDRAFTTDFAAGLAAWREGDFPRAERSFREAAARRPDDGPTRLYLERLRAAGPAVPEGWDGTTTLTVK